MTAPSEAGAPNALRHHAWDAAIHLFGTAAIFDERARSLKTRLNWLKVTGIVLPVLLGATVATFGADWPYVKLAIAVTGAVGIVQLVMSCVSLAMKWDDEYAAALEAKIHGRRLSEEYKKVAEQLPPDHAQRLALLDIEKMFRDQLDEKSGITPNEKRFGLRTALHQFQRPCVTCKKVPSPRSPSSCEDCGK